MAFLTELDVINDMLATLGESPLNAIEDDHPMVAAGVRFLKVASWREQAKGWWFNKEVVTLSPDDDGYILTPADAISVDPLKPENLFVQRGRRLYNTENSSYKFTQEVKCAVTRSIPFEDHPPSAASYIAQCAVMEFQISYDADGQKTRLIERNVREALAALNTEHIRNQQVNLLYRPSVQYEMARMGFFNRNYSRT